MYFFLSFFYMCIDRVFYLLSRIFSHMYVVPLVVSRYEYSVLCTYKLTKGDRCIAQQKTPNVGP